MHCEPPELFELCCSANIPAPPEPVAGELVKGTEEHRDEFTPAVLSDHS